MLGSRSVNGLVQRGWWVVDRAGEAPGSPLTSAVQVKGAQGVHNLPLKGGSPPSHCLQPLTAPRRQMGALCRGASTDQKQAAAPTKGLFISLEGSGAPGFLLCLGWGRGSGTEAVGVAPSSVGDGTAAPGPGPRWGWGDGVVTEHTVSCRSRTRRSGLPCGGLGTCSEQWFGQQAWR